jgi:hypothetical protein
MPADHIFRTLKPFKADHALVVGARLGSNLLLVRFGRLIFAEQPIDSSGRDKLLIDRFAGTLSAPFVEQCVEDRRAPAAAVRGPQAAK